MPNTPEVFNANNFPSNGSTNYEIYTKWQCLLRGGYWQNNNNSNRGHFDNI